MAKGYSDEVRNYVLQQYDEGNSAAEISRITKVNEATIRGWIKSSGRIIRSASSYFTVYDTDLVERIESLYNEGLYTSQIEEELGLKRGIAAYLLRKYNVNLRHRGPKSKIQDENFFDSIDSQEKAYYLGWLLADGNISIVNGQYCLKIHIALKDKEIIDNFLEVIKSDNKTNIKNSKYASYYVSLTSVHMCKMLIKYGIKPQKSGKEELLEPLSEELMHHFIRGVFDGDGITDISRNRSGFVGSKDLLTLILNCLEEDKKLYQNKKNPDIFYFLGGKKFSRKLYKYLYKDALVWLSRKKDRLEHICF